VLFFAKKWLGPPFWAIFSQAHLVTLLKTLAAILTVATKLSRISLYPFTYIGNSHITSIAELIYTY
jgi:hypothetical protein